MGSENPINSPVATDATIMARELRELSPLKHHNITE